MLSPLPSSSPFPLGLKEIKIQTHDLEDGHKGTEPSATHPRPRPGRLQRTQLRAGARPPPTEASDAVHFQLRSRFQGHSFD